MSGERTAAAFASGEIVCEAPNNNLEKFEGKLTWKGHDYALDNEKILLRGFSSDCTLNKARRNRFVNLLLGCVLRNTKWCFGMVIYAGKDTKLMQNSGVTHFKRTNIDRLMNVLIFGVRALSELMCLHHACDEVECFFFYFTDPLVPALCQPVLHGRQWYLGARCWLRVPSVPALGVFHSK